MSSELAEIRKAKHAAFIKKIHLPTLRDYIKNKKNKDNSAETTIYYGIKNMYFPEPINISSDELEFIPGIYRMRLKVGETNLIKPVIESVNKATDYANSDIQNIINQSRREYEEKYQKELNNALKISINNDTNNTFNICIDLRIYGPDPQQPVYIADVPYYFSLEQINKIKKAWVFVNPSTALGIRTKTKLDFYQSMALDYRQ